MDTHRFHPGFCCGCGGVLKLPEKVHHYLIWSLGAQWDEWQSRIRFEPREKSLEELKEASKWLFEAGIIRFDPLKDR